MFRAPVCYTDSDARLAQLVEQLVYTEWVGGSSPSACTMEPTVLYEDEAVIVLNKPSGLAVHGDGKHAYPLLTDWLLKRYPELAHVGEPQTLLNGTVIERPGIVHRLDRETSGVMIVARTPEAFAHLKEQFKERMIRKVYRAFVHGALKDERGIIDKPIGSGRNGIAPRSARTPHGIMREAITLYRVIERSPQASYVEVFPKTGRTHQIRVHFSAVQHPIIGDMLYAPRRPFLLGFTRLALHAYALSFSHPVTGKTISIEAPLPKEFLEAANALHEGENRVSLSK